MATSINLTLPVGEGAFQSVTFTTPHIEASARSSQRDEYDKVHHEKTHLNRIRRLRLTNRVDVSVSRVTRPRSVATTKQEQAEAAAALRHADNDDTADFEFDPDFDFDADPDEDREHDEDEFFFGNSRVNSAPGNRNKKQEITVDIYKRACRKLGTTPQGALIRQLTSTELSMRHSHMGQLGVKACAIALVYNYHVTELDLAGCDIGGLGCEYIAEILTVNTSINTLILADNGISLRGLQCLCDVVGNSRFVEHLDLSSNMFGESGGDHIADLIEETTSLKSLNLSHNRLSEYGAIAVGSALPENTSLEFLDLSWNHVRLKGAVGISAGLKDNSSLKTLLLGWNGFYLDGCCAMANALRHNTTLEKLDMTNNRIGPDAVKNLCQGLKANTTLVSLNLNLNPIGNEGALYIFKTILDTPTSAIVDINIENQAIEEQTARILDEGTTSQNRILKVTYGQVLRQRDTTETQDDSINDDPLIVLMEYMRQKNMRLLDLFNSLDADGSKSLSRDEFREGLQMVNIPLSSQGLDRLLDILDADGDGEVDFSELMEGQKEFRRRIMKMGAGRTNSTENNTFTRIQTKVRALLQLRTKQFKSAAMAARGHDVQQHDSTASMGNAMQMAVMSGVESAQKQARIVRRQTTRDRKTINGVPSSPSSPHSKHSPLPSPRMPSPRAHAQEERQVHRANSPINMQGLPPV